MAGSKMFSVAVSIGGKIDSSLGGAIGKAESMFSGMTRSLKKQAAAQHAALAEMRNAAGVALSGLGLGHGISHALGAGAEYNKEVIALKNAGRTAQEVADGIAKANATVVKLPTTTLAENLKLLNETTGAFGDFHHALENLDFNAKLSSVMQGSFGDKLGDPGEAFNHIVRAMEIRGSASNPEKYQREMGKMYQAMAFTRGNVNPEQFLLFAQHAGNASRYIDEEFLTRIAPSLIQEFKGDKAGTGLKAFRKVIRGGISDSIQAKEWVKMDLVNKDKVRLNKAGQVQGWSSGAVTKTDLAFSNPLKWMEEVMLKKLAKKGINVNDEIALGKEFDVLFKNDKSNVFAGAIGFAKSRARLHKDAGLIDIVPTMDKAYENNMDDVKTGVMAVKNAFENLFVSLSGPLLKPASHALVGLAMGVQRVAAFLNAHPTLGGGFGIAAGAASGVAGLAILRSSLSMLGLAGFGPIRLIKAELFSLAATASGAAAGSIRMLRGAVLTLINPVRLVTLAFRSLKFAVASTGVGLALVAIAAAGTFISNNWAGLGRFFTEFGSAFTAALGPETTRNLQPIIDFGGRLLGIFQSVTAEISPDKWAKWGAAAGVATADAVKWVEALPARLPEIAGRFASGVADLAAKGAAALAGFDWSGAGRAISATLGGLAKQGIADLTASLNAVDWENVGRSAVNGLLAIAEAYRTAAIGLAKTFVSAFEAYDWSGLGTAILGGLKAVGSAMGGIAKGAANAFTAYNWADTGRAIVDGIISGISGMGGALASSLTGMASSGVGKLRSMLGLGPVAASVPAPVAAGSPPGRRGGGAVAGGRPYMVGENGPEIIVPGASGNVVANHQLAGLIRASSKNLGIKPGDLASVISYETAGTMDKWKAGPHTRWGQHRGYIQWGEPQARAAGVNENSTPAEQMTAVEGYLRHAGIKPGMGLLDLYSAVNAGRIGKYGASDGHGTVASHVGNIMAAHGNALANLDGRKHPLGFARSHFGERGGKSGHPLRPGEVDPSLTKMIARASEIMGVPLGTESGYRSPEHNRKVGGARHSLHTQGRASDLSSPGHGKNDPAFWTRVNAAMRQAAGEQGQAYRWGGNFGGKYLHDWNHFDIGQGGPGGAAAARAVGARARGYGRAHFGGPRRSEGAPAALPIAPPPMAALAAAAGGGGGGSGSTKRTHFQGGAISVEVNVNGAGGSPDEVGRQVAYEVRKVMAQYESEQRGMLSD